MQFWNLTIIFLAIYAAGVHSLQCYVCLGDECANIKDSMSQYCGPQITTTAPPETNTDSTIESNISTTETQENTAETTVGSTITTTNTKETTEEPVTTTLSTTETSTTTAAPEGNPETPDTDPEQLVRQRRSFPVNPVFNFKDEVLESNQLRLRGTRANPSYFCYSASVPDGDGTKRRHGCVEVPAEWAACDAVLEENNIPANPDTNYDCQYCQTDNCNGSMALRVSLLTFLAAFLVHKFLK